MIGQCSEHMFRKQFSKHLTGGYKDTILQFTMEKIPEELWTFIGQFLNQQRIVDSLTSRLKLTNDNLNHMVDDNISLQHECDLLHQRVAVLERTQLMLQRYNSQLKRKNIVLRSRIDLLEERSKSRRIGPTINRIFDYESAVDISSDSEATVIELSDTEQVNV
jgi:SMC interacting uncharacterized protein involved in chromosome segregation